VITVTSLESPTLRICVLRGELTTVRLQGELDFASVHVVEAAACLVPPGAAVVTVDLDGLTFIDGSGADALAAFHAAQVIRGRKVRLTNPRSHIRRILGILGMDSLLGTPRSRMTAPVPHQPDWLRTTPLPQNPRTTPGTP
jgi:anti-anti-sigma factor